MAINFLKKNRENDQDENLDRNNLKFLKNRKNRKKVSEKANKKINKFRKEEGNEAFDAALMKSKETEENKVTKIESKPVWIQPQQLDESDITEKKETLNWLKLEQTIVWDEYQNTNSKLLKSNLNKSSNDYKQLQKQSKTKLTEWFGITKKIDELGAELSTIESLSTDLDKHIGDFEKRQTMLNDKNNTMTYKQMFDKVGADQFRLSERLRRTKLQLDYLEAIVIWINISKDISKGDTEKRKMAPERVVSLWKSFQKIGDLLPQS